MFWIGWSKKIKEIFTKKEADKFYVKLSGDEAINGVKTFNSQINVPNPTNNNNAVNKSYVDNKIKVNSGSGQIGQGNQQSIFNISNKKVLSVIIYRKRQVDGYWFIANDNSAMGYQLFLNGNFLILWNSNSAGRPTQFTNDYKWDIIFMENFNRKRNCWKIFWRKEKSKIIK